MTTDTLDLLSEAAVEIENLTDRYNPVALRLRAAIAETRAYCTHRRAFPAASEHAMTCPDCGAVYQNRGGKMKGKAMKTIQTTRWMIDGSIDLLQTCVDSEWHLATAVGSLMERGLSRDDAQAFADFAFADVSLDEAPEDQVTDEQYDRITAGETVLFNAAPDLLKALRALADHASPELFLVTSEEHIEAHRSAREAIRKATA